MFLTDPAEYKYMGLTHPANDKCYVYRTLPMGTRNSPGASGRFGAAFIRTIIETSDLFEGKAIDASVQQFFPMVFHILHMEKDVCLSVLMVFLQYFYGFM